MPDELGETPSAISWRDRAINLKDEVARSYPKGLERLRKKTQWFTEALAKYETPLSSPTIPPDRKEKFNQLAEDLAAFILLINEPTLKEAERAEYKEITYQGKVIASPEQAREERINYVVEGGVVVGEINRVTEALEKSARPYGSRDWLDELTKTQIMKEKLLKLAPAARQIRAVTLSMAAKLTRGLGPSVIDLFKENMDKVGITTDAGNPVDVAIEMLSEARLVGAQS